LKQGQEDGIANEHSNPDKRDPDKQSLAKSPSRCCAANGWALTVGKRCYCSKQSGENEYRRDMHRVAHGRQDAEREHGCRANQKRSQR